MISKYFDHTEDKATQGMIQSLVNESIQQKGIDTTYIKRDDFSPDFLFGESHSITNYKNTIIIEMLIKDYNGGGYNDILEKFGLILEDTLNLQVSIKRFEEEAVINKMELSRPEIGDLVYIDYINSVFEIKKVYFSDEDTLYQRGVNYFHTLELMLFEPSLGANNFETNDEDINSYDLDYAAGEADEIDDEDKENDIITDWDRDNFDF